MVGIHSLSAELLIQIFVESGATDGIWTADVGQYIPGGQYPDPAFPPGRKSRDLYSLATSCKSLYATFKTNEYTIFLELVKRVVVEFEPRIEMTETGWYWTHSKPSDWFVYWEVLCLRQSVARPLMRCMGALGPVPRTIEGVEAQVERWCQKDVREVIKPEMFGWIMGAIRERIRSDWFRKARMEDAEWDTSCEEGFMGESSDEESDEDEDQNED